MYYHGTLIVVSWKRYDFHVGLHVSFVSAPPYMYVFSENISSSLIHSSKRLGYYKSIYFILTKHLLQMSFFISICWRLILYF